MTFHTAIASLRRTGTRSYNHLLVLPAAYTALGESFESSLSLTSLHVHHARCGNKLFTSPLYPILDVTVLTSIIYIQYGRQLRSNYPLESRPLSCFIISPLKEGLKGPLISSSKIPLFSDKEMDRRGRKSMEPQPREGSSTTSSI